MPKAEAGTPKALANKMKAKGLQRLRWYCQICERQMRDENGFKQHTMSEGHVRSMQLVGSNTKSVIDEFSSRFKHDFITLLRTSHGEKYVHVNHFYQEYIANKDHIHMNATKWPSLIMFAQYLGREKICRVKEEEKGLFISWIDDSPDAQRRNNAIQQKDRQDRSDEQREQKLLQQQIERAQLRAKQLELLKEMKSPEDGQTATNSEDKGESGSEEQPTPIAPAPIKFGFAAAKPASSTASLQVNGSKQQPTSTTSNAKGSVNVFGRSTKKASAQPKSIFR